MALYDDLINNKTLTQEQKVQAIKSRGEAERKKIDRDLYKSYGRIGVGALLEGASLHPIFNIPYVGTGIGGAMFEAGNAIMEGKSGSDIAKDAGKGFAIGEAAGAIPYVGKVAGKTKVGQGAKTQAGNLFNYLTNTKVGQARVIFNPDDIDIVRKYYNQPQAMEYFQNLQPNLGAVVNSFEHTPVNTKEWKQYAKNNLIGNSVDIPGYTTVNFTNKNLGKDYPYNMPEYPTLLEDLANSQYAFSTNYYKEADRLYDHLVNNKKGLYDYLIEVIKDKEGNIHHNYKMMKNINRGDKP